MEPSTAGMTAYSELGHGAQFKAYDMQNGRVLKIPLTEAETYQVARRRRNIIHGTVEEIASLEMRVQTFMNSKARIPAMVQHSFQDPTPFLHLLGDPVITPVTLPEDTHEKKWGGANFVYAQNKVEIARGMLNAVAALPQLRSGDKQKLKQYIEDYVQYVYNVWEYGYSDYIFKLGDTGIDAQGNLITVDLGEWTSDLDFMVRAINEKWWLDNVNHAKHDFPKLPTSLEPFYIKTLEHAFTETELRKRWRAKHVCTSCTTETTNITAFVSARVAEIDYIDRL
jgi:hypothetical protein